MAWDYDADAFGYSDNSLFHKGIGCHSVIVTIVRGCHCNCRLKTGIYRVGLVVVDLGWVDFDLAVPQSN